MEAALVIVRVVVFVDHHVHRARAESEASRNANHGGW